MGNDGGFEYLDVEDLIHLATLLLGDPSPIRDVGLLGSAAARPQTTVFGEDAYPDTWTKAAALLQSVVKNHPLGDGNKRLGWLATAVFLELNDTTVVHATNDDVYDFVVAVAGGKDTIEGIASALRRIVGGDDPGARPRTSDRRSRRDERIRDRDGAVPSDPSVGRGRGRG